MPKATKKSLESFETEHEPHAESASDTESVFGDSDNETQQTSLVLRKNVESDEESEKREEAPPRESAVVYLGRIPHGFYENEMRSYFSQFGDVKRLRLSRSKKTGASKHYAFIEFAYPSVARIVAETMNNYLLAGHILACHIIPREDIHPKLWVGADRKFRPIPQARRFRLKHDRERSAGDKAKLVHRVKRRNRNRQDRLKNMGIDYDFSL